MTGRTSTVPFLHRDASGDLDRLVEVCRVDQEVAAELLARFGERAVRYLALSVRTRTLVAVATGCSGEARRSFPCWWSSCVRAVDSAKHCLRSPFGPGFFVGVDEQHVLHRFLLGNGRRIAAVRSIVVREVRKSTRGRIFLPQFPKAFLKETAFRFLLGQGQSPFVRFAGVGRSSQPAAQVGAGRVGQVVVGQIAAGQDVVDQVQARPPGRRAWRRRPLDSRPRPATARFAAAHHTARRSDSSPLSAAVAASA